MTEESSSPGGWTQIGYLTEMDGKSFGPTTVWFKPLATPGEIENCVECGSHAQHCAYRMDLIHMREVHSLHDGGPFIVGFDGAKS